MSSCYPSCRISTVSCIFVSYTTSSISPCRCLVIVAPADCNRGRIHYNREYGLHKLKVPVGFVRFMTRRVRELGDLLDGDNLLVQLLCLGQRLGHRKPQNLIFVVSSTGRNPFHVSGHQPQDEGSTHLSIFMSSRKIFSTSGGLSVSKSGRC